MANDRRRRGGFGFGGPSLTGPGNVFTLAFIVIAIGMGVLLSRGVTPSNILSDPGQTDAELEVEEDTSENGQRGLQLKTLKFKECGSTVTVDLLLDRSGSMGNPTPSRVTKIARLKEAVLELIAGAQDESIIGIQSFAFSPPTNDVPISYFRDVKSTIAQKVQLLPAIGNTWTHDALALSYQELQRAIPVFPPDRKFNFIFISDGEPNPQSQDPRLFNPNPADQIKALGVTVYSLGIFDAGQAGQPQLSDLLKSIATSPDHYYAANTADDTKRLLSQITTRICNSSVSPTPTP